MMDQMQNLSAPAADCSTNPKRMSRDARTLILCYHKFSQVRGERSRYVIPLDSFGRQVEFLRACGFRFVTFRELIRSWSRNEALPARTAIITIDDGSVDVIETAAPMLERKKIPAVVFLIANHLGRPGNLSVSQIELLSAQGWEIGSHSLSHPHLPMLTESEQREEVSESRIKLADLFGKAPETFAYPYGEADLVTARLAKEAGYAAALGVKRGFSSIDAPRWNLPRFLIDGRWPNRLFGLLIRLESLRFVLNRRCARTERMARRVCGGTLFFQLRLP
ncbi:MAG TPA: polysaccharide deacetylase family protein [Candidatus Binataceae bacterium]|nr:polysaccharide deacetylase family protein [Candidatus Binataceae bacterium]